MEEQKPEDYLLEKEIKQEDISEEIKEEPLEEKDQKMIEPCLQTTSNQNSKSHIQQYVIRRFSTQKIHPYYSAQNTNKNFNQQMESRSDQRSAHKNRDWLNINWKSKIEENKRLVSCRTRSVEPQVFCSVCSQEQFQKDVKQVSLKKEKLIIMIGCILKGNCNNGEARLLLSGKIGLLWNICHVHFFKAFNEISKVLHITRFEEIAFCSLELVNNLIPTVNTLLHPWHLTPWDFRADIRKFAERNSHIINSARVIMPVQWNLGEQSPINTIDNEDAKKEFEYFMDNVKEEPLKEDYYEQNIPKVTLISSCIPTDSENAVSEFSNYASSKYLVEKVKEEPIETEEYSELTIPKQESEEALENIKTEPIDEEEDYYEQDITKNSSINNCVPVVQNNLISDKSIVLGCPKSNRNFFESLIFP